VTEGTILGFEGEGTARLCDTLCERFHMDRVKLSNTSLDATLFAIRFARHFTRRPGILKFEGCYHGSHDALLASVKPTPVVDWRTFLDLDVGRWSGYYAAMMNRGIIPMATGPDEQRTVSVQHAVADIDAHLEAFGAVARLLPSLHAAFSLVESV